jgi:hypothetical protein
MKKGRNEDDHEKKGNQKDYKVKTKIFFNFSITDFLQILIKLKKTIISFSDKILKELSIK